MRAFPPSWTEKKRYVLIETQGSVQVETLLERMSGMLGLARARPVRVLSFTQDAFTYTVIRVTRGFEDLLRASLALHDGYVRIVCLSGSLRGIRRKAWEEGIRVPSREQRKKPGKRE